MGVAKKPGRSDGGNTQPGRPGKVRGSHWDVFGTYSQRCVIVCCFQICGPVIVMLIFFFNFFLMKRIIDLHNTHSCTQIYMQHIIQTHIHTCNTCTQACTHTCTHAHTHTHTHTHISCLFFCHDTSCGLCCCSLYASWVSSICNAGQFWHTKRTLKSSKFSCVTV